MFALYTKRVRGVGPRRGTDLEGGDSGPARGARLSRGCQPSARLCGGKRGALPSFFFPARLLFPSRSAVPSEKSPERAAAGSPLA